MIAKESHGCFVGIPLPKNLNLEFGRLLSDVREIDPLLKPTAFRPHITLLFIDGLFKFQNDKVFQATMPMLPILRKKSININGYGEFEDCTMFLRVPSPPAELEEFHNKLVKEFGDDGKSLFQPHITVCKNIENSLTMDNRRQLIDRFNEVDWSFPITRLMVR